MFELHQPGAANFPVTLLAHKDPVKAYWLKEIRQYSSDVVALAEHAADDLQLTEEPEVVQAEPGKAEARPAAELLAEAPKAKVPKIEGEEEEVIARALVPEAVAGIEICVPSGLSSPRTETGKITESETPKSGESDSPRTIRSRRSSEDSSVAERRKEGEVTKYKGDPKR